MHECVCVSVCLYACLSLCICVLLRVTNLNRTHSDLGIPQVPTWLSYQYLSSGLGYLAEDVSYTVLVSAYSPAEEL